MQGDDEVPFGCSVLGREAVGEGPGVHRVPYALVDSREAEAFRPIPAMGGGTRRDDKLCGADGAVPAGAGAGDVSNLHEPDPRTGREPIAVSHLDALLGDRCDVEGVDAPDPGCEFGPRSLFDQAGFDRLTAYPGGQVAKLRVDIDGGDPVVRRGLRTALGRRQRWW